MKTSKTILQVHSLGLLHVFSDFFPEYGNRAHRTELSLRKDSVCRSSEISTHELGVVEMVLCYLLCSAFDGKNHHPFDPCVADDENYVSDISPREDSLRLSSTVSIRELGGVGMALLYYQLYSTSGAKSHHPLCPCNVEDRVGSKL